MSTKELLIIHSNDSYRLDERASEPVGGAARICTAIANYKPKNPLITFGGDIFSPSIQSMVTKGKHMVAVMNLIGFHFSVVGNHDFDFGVENLGNLISTCKFPWLLSNVTAPPAPDQRKGKQLVSTLEYSLFEWYGVKVGIIGLVEQEWIVTLTIPKESIFYVDFVEEGRRLATMLREQGAEVVIALTHMRVPNDEKLAKEVPEIDIILGGHDHFVYHNTIGNTVLAKSGEDFQYLSEIKVTITDGKKHIVNTPVKITKSFEEDQQMVQLVAYYKEIMEKKMGKPLAKTDVVLDASSENVRTREANIGNYVTDVLRKEFCADIAILNGGTIRSGERYGPGLLTLKELLQLFPMEDICICIEASGEQILGALENSVSQYPKQEGRFAQVSGLRFYFDPSRPSGSRVTKVEIGDYVANNFTPLDLQKKYSVATKTYMTTGKDGFTSLLDVKFLVGEENGRLLSQLLRHHWLKLKVAHLLLHHSDPVRLALEKWTHKATNDHLPLLNPKVEGRIIVQPNSS